MRVFVSVAMTGEVLAARNDPAISQAFDPFMADFDDACRIGSERTVADDGIPRIRIHVQNGRKVEIDTHQGKLGGGGFAGSVSEIGIVSPSDESGGGERRGRRGEGGEPAP